MRGAVGIIMIIIIATLIIISMIILIIRRTEGTEGQGVSDPKHPSLLAS